MDRPADDSQQARPSSAARVALAHDYLLVMRGAERTFSQIASMWPHAPIYTLLHDRRAMNSTFGQRRVETSWLQHLRAQQRSFRALLPLFPGAAEGLRTDRFDLVVSSSSAFAHGVPHAEGALHVCYCHTPLRYVWQDYAQATRRISPVARPFVRPALSRIRDWDRRVAQDVTHYIANSELTRQRIEEFWGREAVVVNPPVEVSRFDIGEPEDYFLVVAELVRHKRVDIALEAAARGAQRIKVVGEGPELRRLRTIYGSTAEFLGRVSDAELARLYASARALIVPNVEEFGIAAVEAQASGRPVIGASVGGTCETVIDGETGILVTPEHVGALAEAMSQVDFDRFSPQRIQAHARQFGPEFFRRRFSDALHRLTGLRPPVADTGTVPAQLKVLPSSGRASAAPASHGITARSTRD